MNCCRRCSRRLLGIAEGRDVARLDRAHRDEAHGRGVDVDADDPVRRSAADRRRDDRAGVAALHAEALVAEARHQLEQRAGDAAVVPAGLAGRAGEAEARAARG